MVTCCCLFVGADSLVASDLISFVHFVCRVVKRTCEYLVRTHMERNDKVIIFGDNVFSLKKVAWLDSA